MRANDGDDSNVPGHNPRHDSGHNLEDPRHDVE